jgi:hypothetical protein
MAKHVPSNAGTTLMQLGDRKITDRLSNGLQDELGLHTATFAQLANVAHEFVIRRAR